MRTSEIVRRRLQRMDWLMWAAVAALMALGVVFIYSAGYRRGELPVSGFYKKQIVWALFGVGVCLAAAVTDYRKLARWTGWIYAGSLFLLVLVLVLGTRVHGAARWLTVFGMNLQPAEVAKVAVILSLAHTLGRPGRDLAEPKCLLQCAFLAGVPFILIVKQPDLGTAAVLIPVTFAMLFAAGTPLKILSLVMLLGMMLLPIGWLGLDDYQQERILVFFDAGRDPLGAGWNKIQSEIAVGSGGLTGKGLLQGHQNILGYLPRPVAPTDFIFSVIAEEMGFMGSMLILGLFLGLVVAGTRAAVRASDRFGMLICVGVVTMLFSHVFVNIAMTIGLMPITGLPLPLISYGGSFMVSTMLSIGLMQSVTIRRLRT